MSIIQLGASYKAGGTGFGSTDATGAVKRSRYYRPPITPTPTPTDASPTPTPTPEPTPTPTPTPSIEMLYELDTANYTSIINLPADGATEVYRGGGGGISGIGIWLVDPDDSTRQLIHFYDSGDFTEGDILDFTNFVVDNSIFETGPGTSRIILATFFTASSGGNYEYATANPISSVTGVATATNLDAIPQAPDPWTYQFIHKLSEPGDVQIRDMNDFVGVTVDDYTAVSIRLAIIQNLPALPPPES